MLASTSVSALLATIGVALFVISAVAMGQIQGGVEDPLRSAGLATRERARIRGMILRRELSDESPGRALEFQWAAYATSTFAKALRWRPLFGLGFIAIFCGLYSFAGLSVAAVVLQNVLFLLQAWLFAADIRRIMLTLL
jgi:hypothetical protein